MISNMFVKAWQIHPKACRIKRAEKTCMGLANEGGVRWCGPYTNANKAGFWLYSPIEMDFTYDGEKFEIHGMEDYGPEDYEKVKELVRPSDNAQVEKWSFPGVGRTKTTVGLVEKNVIQIWTGLIFETPPGWCLHIRSPVNFPKNGLDIVEAILETDWMQYDIWMNVSCSAGRHRITKEMPIAQVIPTRRETFKAEWVLEREEINRDGPESDKVFSYWLSYNKQKFEMGGRQPLTETLTKDSTTYFKERNRMVGKGMESEKRGCPFMSGKKTLEEELKEFKDARPKADFFPVFEKDPSQSLKSIGGFA